MWCKSVGFVCRLAPLLILRSVGIFVLRFCRFIVELSVVLHLLVTFCSYPKVAISKHFIVTPAGTLIEAQSFIEPINRHFWVGAVTTSYLYLLSKKSPAFLKIGPSIICSIFNSISNPVNKIYSNFTNPYS
jgi:hypothetical protein